MIYKRKYVKELIQKQIKGILTSREAGELDACRRIYAPEEIQEMIADVLLRMEEDELPEGQMDGWKPDFTDIIRVAGQRSPRGPGLWHRVGWSAAVLIPVMTLLIYWYDMREQTLDFGYGPCAGLDSDADVPLTASVVSLRWGDTAQMQVAGAMYGELLRTGDVRVFRTEEGVFQLGELRSGTGSSGAKDGIALATGVQQQAMVELPDGTRIRLNAQSTLRYTPAKQKYGQLMVQGEAYVQRPMTKEAVPLMIATGNGFVRSLRGDFALLSMDHLTRAAVLSGALSLHSPTSDEELLLDCHAVQGSIMTYAVPKEGARRDTLSYETMTDTHTLLTWTKAVRKYRDVPLREFVAQMSHWYGFRVKDYRCLPADRRVTATVCYSKGKEAVFAVIREAGVLLRESRGMISFCPEDTEVIKKKEGILAWWE